MRKHLLLFTLALAGASCAPGDELDPSIAGEPDDFASSDSPPDGDDTTYAALSAAERPIARRCVTATVDARTGHTWRYRVDEFTAHDGMVRLWVERTEASGATTHFGSTILHAHPSQTHRWDSRLQNRDRAPLTLWLGRRGNTSTIGVSHRSVNLLARGANGWCSERRAPVCGAGTAFFCSPFSGTCECASLQDPVEYRTASGRTAQLVVIGGVGMTYSGAIAVAGTAALSDTLLPVGDLVAVAIIVYASYQILVLQNANDRGYTAREIAAETGGRMLSAQDISPVPPYERTFSPERQAAGDALLSAIDASLDDARRDYQCRESNGAQPLHTELLWSALRHLVGTARNNGMPLRQVVDIALRALEEFVASQDPACAGPDEAFKRGVLNALCRFYAILAPIPGGSPTGALAQAKAGLESAFNRHRFQCQ